MSTSTPPPIDTPGSVQRQPRTLILCFDGTSNQFDGENTNVVRLYSLLKKDDDLGQQLCYYQPGIGTYFNPGVVSPIFQWCAKILDEAFAWYLDEHVREGYTFLMQNYNPGDKICIFGFSRGAYTARALAGMLHKIGLLPKDNPEQLPFAYNLYKSTDADNVALAAGFKETFCRKVQIEFVGVWETVTSVGVIMSRSLPFTAANTTIKTFRQALSLDEHRVKFQPNLYHWGTPNDTGASARVEEKTSKRPNTSMKRQRSLGSFLRRWPSKQRKNLTSASLPKVRQTVDLEAAAVTITDTSGPSDLSASTSSASSGANGGTDVLEVWFAGCHSDVGGGAVSNSTKLSLSDVTLRWMVRELVLAQCGVQFDQAALKRANIPQSIFQGEGMVLPRGATLHASPRDGAIPLTERKTDPVEDVNVPGQLDPSNPDPSNDENPGQQAPSGPSEGDGGDPLGVDVDALQPLHDQLTADPAWWLLEIIPLPYTITDATGKTSTKWWIHLGRGRTLPDNPKFHITVKERMEDADLKYKPRAVWTAGTETYVQ
ncbi:hypothetical protein DICSQDRAFT_154002 [Dichomitus squalens LYAD-421 SS1]|uniref:T6SS Phospholipase effector Tle1-like catalytic domain-containing protein n=1 Tax=Dichomitus squalens TaxID=114155 RepID=A0A4Q9MME9_9APHY|nr:uncharacterized protein DICSQDRAFT_154002 [Dichomitus squalens LYAD-421 SS1]EJF63499.1 hypothetical protein DICSQDRAFT_154002 [Dichomitus squalens LYAD-421 SS1]TBU27196.1 hypothetical protein BD311DRAFT_665979 [Dichomitus squalens]